MKSLILNGVELDDLLTEIRQIVQQEMNLSSHSEKSEDVEWLDIEQTALFVKKAKQTVYQYCSNSSIPHYRKFGKLYFKKAELDFWLLEGRRGERITKKNW